MVRRVLLVLALLPLLLPPGLCVCRAPTAACTAGTAGHLDDRHAPLAHLCLAHDCPGNHHTGSDSDGPHRHAPGCPALKGLDPWVARPGTAVYGMVLALAGRTVPPDADLPSLAASLSPSRGSPDEPTPLYLTLRTLLI
jgi:hypothetical protein